MVTVKRRHSGPTYSPLPLVSSAERTGSLSFRDALESPRRSASPRKLSSSFASFSKCPEENNFYISRKSLTQDQKHRGKIHWLVKSVYAVAVVSFLTSFCVSDASDLVTDIENEILVAQAHLEHTQRDYDTAREYVQQERSLLNKLKKTRKALDHEVRMIKEVRESSGKPMQAKPNNKKMINAWLDHRKDGLLNKIRYLQSYLQAESLRVALEKYGPGPHQVKMTVDLLNEYGRRQSKSLTIELAPLEWMPHSILFFLDLVENKLWDHTVFLHHEDMEHVIVAAPIDYTTQTIKNMQLNQLGWIQLGFPEYKTDYPHAKYTLGFSGQGPTFFINTKENTISHGPGGQGHHLLESDADPCFAKVIPSDEAVVDEMVRLGAKQKKSGMGGKHPWIDEDHTWTHIVSAEIVKSNTGTAATTMK